METSSFPPSGSAQEGNDSLIIKSIIKRTPLMITEHGRPEFLRLVFSDLLGHMRSYEVGIDQLDDVLENGIVMDGSSVPGYASINDSDVLLRSLSTTPTSQPWDPAAAFLLCGIYETSGKPHPRDPRNILDKMISKASKRGLQLMIGSELEFFTIQRRSDDSIMPLDSGGYFSSRPMDSELDFRRDIVRTLNAVGIPTTSHHHEVARGQHEVGLQYTTASTAADNILLGRQIIMEMGPMRGIDVTFMPKPFDDQNGSGLHLHQSIWETDGSRNLFASKGNGGLSQMAMSYVAGLLEHASSLIALLAPTVNSYKRLVPGFEAPTRIAWGYRNRSTMIRVPHFNGSEKAARIELRCPDTTISPHLAIAAILAAGLDGIERTLEPSEPTTTNLYKSTSDIKSLPGSLIESLALLDESRFMRNELGDSLVDALIAIRMHEWEDYAKTNGDPHSIEIS
ncbi:MAG: glutamine synthetase, partial [Candidatus Thorarchaeota archaeon]|nr:glutamine synthetase [Candidatus Thorarchaeota archaeon]